MSAYNESGGLWDEEFDYLDDEDDYDLHGEAAEDVAAWADENGVDLADVEDFLDADGSEFERHLDDNEGVDPDEIDYEVAMESIDGATDLDALDIAELLDAAQLAGVDLADLLDLVDGVSETLLGDDGWDGDDDEVEAIVYEVPEDSLPNEIGEVPEIGDDPVDEPDYFWNAYVEGKWS
ncbi:hypothetical protein [Demequina lutea]|uniref:Uncharacterized protein n=1 Tax=Demequina lutea TaxID=431489 RepID=A0A7Y9ZCD6_9MICO|nr:hypothetical protein [Demequina lutea]NYI41410.1 hypothetical protein [Demequina lutea]